MLQNYEYLKSDEKARAFLDFLALHQPPNYEKIPEFLAPPRVEPEKPTKSDLKLNLIKADLIKSDLAEEMANLNGNYNLFIKEINRIDQTHLLNPLKNNYYALLEDFKSRTVKFNELMDVAIDTATKDLEQRLDLSTDLEEIKRLNAQIVENQVKNLEAEAWQQQFEPITEDIILSEDDIIDIENDIQRLIYQSENEFDCIQSIKLDLAQRDINLANHKLYKFVLEKLDILIQNVMEKLESQKNMIDVIEQDCMKISAGLEFSERSLDILEKVKSWFSDQKEELYETFRLSDRDQQFIDLSIPLFSRIYDLFYNVNGSKDVRLSASVHRDPFLRKVTEIANQPLERHKTLQKLVADIHNYILRCNDNIDRWTELNLHWSKSRLFCSAPVEVTRAEKKIQDMIAQMQPDIIAIQKRVQI